MNLKACWAYFYLAKYKESKRPSEEGRMILEFATNGVSWAQEFNLTSLSHSNLITTENGEDVALHCKGHYEFPNLGLEPPS